ncbi:SET domain-containing protein [Ruegeria sediminis]|uniref:SET domain-containing protein n=1 Tax=Ruegeria sediminis TaxID=2583820 RepID=A0ABY2WVG6_9RHOB|nr:SET domain-containing protein [Ruegeria sediminis]TMV06365.1 SET domain-containing protein [Ruegeria sediminis]
MLMVRCYLAPSQIEGLGLFCHDDIAKGDQVWRYDRMLDLVYPMTKLDTVDAPARDFLERYSFPDMDRPGYMMLFGDEARFINHAMYPNLDFSDGLRGIAAQDIPAGTELTCDYSDFHTGEIVLQPPRHRVGGLHSTTH